YEITSGSKKYAVRCFQQEVPSVEQRYKAISAKLKALASPYFVDFDFQSSGIKIRGNSYPIVKMDWIEGDTLGVFVSKNRSNSAVLQALRLSFRELEKFLRVNGIAHGDIQNENVVVSASGELKLIDYDGMYVPGLPEGKGNEIGHKHFQHQNRGVTAFGPE